VTELDPSGKLVCLTDCNIPEPPKKEVGEASSPKTRPAVAEVPALAQLLSESICGSIAKLAEEYKTTQEHIGMESVELGMGLEEMIIQITILLLL